MRRRAHTGSALPEPPSPSRMTFRVPCLLLHVLIIVAAPADIDDLIKQLKDAAKSAGLPADTAEAWLKAKVQDGKVDAEATVSRKNSTSTPLLTPFLVLWLSGVRCPVSGSFRVRRVLSFGSLTTLRVAGQAGRGEASRSSKAHPWRTQGSDRPGQAVQPLHRRAPQAGDAAGRTHRRQGQQEEVSGYTRVDIAGGPWVLMR